MLLKRRPFVHALAGLGASATGLTVLAGCGLNTLFPPARAQVRRIGFLSASSREATRPYVDGFLDGLRELGWVEGQNLSIEWRFTDGRTELLPGVAADLVQAQVELIAAVSNQAIVAVQQQTGAIPVVMISVADPVGAGLAASVAKPGGNFTGTRSSPPGRTVKALEFLSQILPGLARLAVMWDKSNQGNAGTVAAVRAMAQASAFDVLELDVRDSPDLDSAFAAATGWGADALLFISTPSLFAFAGHIAELAVQNRLPAAFAGPLEWVAAGGLLTYGASTTAIYRRSATYVDKILHGARPGDLPVEEPREFDLLVNVKTVQALGITIPPEVAAQVTN